MLQSTDTRKFVNMENVYLIFMVGVSHVVKNVVTINTLNYATSNQLNLLMMM